LLAYPLSDFRVHVVERDQHGSRIPADRDVIVIDVGDSALAPHQCVHDGGDAAKYMYYMRQGGHSVPAPHFYVELLRQRLTNAALTATPSRIVYVVGSGDQHAGLFALLALRMIVENVGRVAAYKWQVQWVGRSNLRADRPGAYLWDRSQWPINDPTSGIRVDDTILPGGSLEERLLFGVHFPPEAAGDDVEIRDQLNYLLDDVELEYRIATETGISEVPSVRLGDHLDATGLAKQISTIAI
jgi:hypothetical protein